MTESSLGIPFPDRPVPLPNRNDFEPPPSYPLPPSNSMMSHGSSYPEIPNRNYPTPAPPSNNFFIPEIPQGPPPVQYNEPFIPNNNYQLSHTSSLPPLPSAPVDYGNSMYHSQPIDYPVMEAPAIPKRNHGPLPNSSGISLQKESKREKPEDYHQQTTVSVIHPNSSQRKVRRNTLCIPQKNDFEDNLPDDPRLIKVEDKMDTIQDIENIIVPDHKVQFINLPPPKVSALSFVLPFNSGSKGSIEYNDYGQLVKNCVSLKDPFVDKTFPDHPAHEKCGQTPVKWKRILDINPRATLFSSSGALPSDVVQGGCANSPFLVVLAALAKQPKLLQKVCPTLDWSCESPVPSGQPGALEFVDPYRANVFTFNFWKWGKWIEVIVDDNLPFFGDLPAFSRCRNNQEYWVSLIEKAYAKLHGSYQAIECCTIEDSILDLTGGSCETLNLNIPPSQYDILWDTLKIFKKNNFLMFCSIETEDRLAANRVLVQPNGLLIGRPYQITDCIQLKPSKSNYSRSDKLVKLSTIWEGYQWKGEWGPDSKEMIALSAKNIQKNKLTFGKLEFWMPLHELVAQFDSIHIGKPLAILKKPCFSVLEDLESYGSPKFHNWAKNPQYLVTVNSSDDILHISMLQQDWKIFVRDTKKTQLSIGFVLFKVEDNRDVKIHRIGEITAISEYTNRREASIHARVTKGRYIILPSTYEKKTTFPCYLRIWTEKSPCQCKLLKRGAPKKGFLKNRHTGVLTVEIVKAKGLKKAGVISCDPYAEVSVEGSTKKTTAASNTVDPEWGQRFIFFLRKPEKASVKITIWHNGLVLSTFMGTVKLSVSELLHKSNGATYRCSVPLEARKKDEKQGREITGYIVVRLNYFGDIKSC